MARAVLLLLLPALGAGACTKDPEIVWVQFNADDEQLHVEVGIDEDPGVLDAENCSDASAEPEGCLGMGCICLHSSTGRLQVGEAAISPAFGPIGTEHQLLVVVDDDFEEKVQRVTVLADAGKQRGVEEFELVQDSADDGTWEVVLESLGDSTSERRTDAFTILLFEPIEEAAAPVEEEST